MTTPEQFIEEGLSQIANTIGTVGARECKDIAIQAVGMARMELLPQLKSLRNYSKGNRMLIGQIDLLIARYEPPTIAKAAGVE